MAKHLGKVGDAAAKAAVKKNPLTAAERLFRKVTKTLNASQKKTRRRKR